MKRRDLLSGTLALGAAMTFPSRVFAQASGAGARDRRLFEVARQQLDKAGEAIWHRDVVGLADFGLRSSERRFHFLHMESGLVDSYFVSHGTGSDPEHDGWLNGFSNVHGSNATSSGAFVTWEWYVGRYGTSIRLGGLDETNDNALERLIVMHRAAYAEPDHIARWGRLGRSNGCFAMGEEQFRKAMLTLSGGRLLFSDALGLAEDGSTVAPPPPAAAIPPAAGEIEGESEAPPRLLLPDEMTDAQRYNPGLF